MFHCYLFNFNLLLSVTFKSFHSLTNSRHKRHVVVYSKQSTTSLKMYLVVYIYVFKKHIWYISLNKRRYGYTYVSATSTQRHLKIPKQVDWFFVLYQFGSDIPVWCKGEDQPTKQVKEVYNLVPNVVVQKSKSASWKYYFRDIKYA